MSTLSLVLHQKLVWSIGQVKLLYLDLAQVAALFTCLYTFMNKILTRTRPFSTSYKDTKTKNPMTIINFQLC